jgi:hypothetical protein
MLHKIILAEWAIAKLLWPGCRAFAPAIARAKRQMRVVVSDRSCLIDLRKMSLLDAFLKLRYEIPEHPVEEGLLKFTEVHKQAGTRSRELVTSTLGLAVAEGPKTRWPAVLRVPYGPNLTKILPG